MADDARPPAPTAPEAAPDDAPPGADGLVAAPDAERAVAEFEARRARYRAERKAAAEPDHERTIGALPRSRPPAEPETAPMAEHALVQAPTTALAPESKLPARLSEWRDRMVERVGVAERADPPAPSRPAPEPARAPVPADQSAPAGKRPRRKATGPAKRRKRPTTGKAAAPRPGCAELLAALRAAADDCAILERLAELCWWSAPEPMLDTPRAPSVAEIGEWLNSGACPADAFDEADRAAAAVYGRRVMFESIPTRDGWRVAMLVALQSPLALPGPVHQIPMSIEGPDGSSSDWSLLTTLTDLHARWREAGGEHPVRPLVDTWLRRPSPRSAFVPVNHASLPRLAKLGKDEATLPDFPIADAPPPSPDGQLTLPGFGDAVSHCTSWLLWLFDQAGGASMASGRGAPWDLRLFVYALLHLSTRDRDGAWHTIRLPTSTVIDWLHPSGWANERRDWYRLPEALDRMRRLAYVPVPGIGRVGMLFPSVIPSARTDPFVEFTARVPRVAAHGDGLRWPRLVDYGTESARLFRAYLSVAAWLGRSARRGHPLTRTIAAPVLGPDGKPARRKDGAIVRSETERTENPAARYAGPPLSGADLTRMLGFDATDRYRRRDARLAFKRMEADGVIEIDHTDAGCVLYSGPNW